MNTNDTFFSIQIDQLIEKLPVSQVYTPQKRRLDSLRHSTLEGRTSQVDLKIPVWMEYLMTELCPGFNMNAFVVKNYGSRPEGLSIRI
jgi:hypothetical protein